MCSKVGWKYQTFNLRWLNGLNIHYAITFEIGQLWLLNIWGQKSVQKMCIIFQPLDNKIYLFYVLKNNSTKRILMCSKKAKQILVKIKREKKKIFGCLVFWYSDMQTMLNIFGNTSNKVLSISYCIRYYNLTMNNT